MPLEIFSMPLSEGVTVGQKDEKHDRIVRHLLGRCQTNSVWWLGAGMVMSGSGAADSATVEGGGGVWGVGGGGGGEGGLGDAGEGRRGGRGWGGGLGPVGGKGRHRGGKLFFRWGRWGGGGGRGGDVWGGEMRRGEMV